MSVQVADLPDRPLMIHERWAAASRPATSAHEVDGPTPCVVCGGPCEPAEVHWGSWRRHRDCAKICAHPVDRMQAAARALGHSVDRTDAGLLLGAGVDAPLYSQGHPEPTWSEEPTRQRMRWHHVDRNALAAAVQRLPELRAEAGLVDAPCVDGCCAWCGVREARGWASQGHRWADGSPAPLCGRCSEVYERRGSPDPTWWDGQRALIAEALTGVPAMMGQTPPPVRALAEAEDTGSGEAWSHLPVDAVEAYRWAAWGRCQGRYAPPEHRAEAVRRAQQAEAAKARHTAETQAREQARLDVYGFGDQARP